MSGEETLAQVYREVESPKLNNFEKAAFIVFVYSLALTASISFLAVLLIPDEVRMKLYSDNLIGGLAMHVMGPPLARLCLNAFVVVVGFLILAGAVNTAMIGSNGVLNRVAEDGVLPDWFLKPHHRYGTTHRVLYLIVILQLITIMVSRGNMYVLGEAYAFGVVWSFVFKAAAMVVLRFKDRSPRAFKVPLNVRVRGVEVPIGLILVFLVLLATAILNVLTKEVATIGGMTFTMVFLATFMLSERYHEKKRGSAAHHHLEQFNRRTADDFDPEMLGLSKPYRKLVAIRSSQNLFMLEKALLEADPETTDIVVMTAKLVSADKMTVEQQDFDHYDQELMTAVVSRAEKIGKQVKPLITTHQQSAVCRGQYGAAAGAQELIMGASNKYTADEQLEQIAFYWMNVDSGQMTPADGAAVEPASRRVSRPGRRQSHSQDQRAAGQIGRGVAPGGSGRQSRTAGPSRHGRGERSVQGGHHHARSARRHERGSAADQSRRPTANPGCNKTSNGPNNCGASWTSRLCRRATSPRGSWKWPSGAGTTWSSSGRRRLTKRPPSTSITWWVMPPAGSAWSLRRPSRPRWMRSKGFRSCWAGAASCGPTLCGNATSFV